MRLLLAVMCLAAPAFADTSVAPDAKIGDFELSWSRQEHSMDSNGQSETFTLKGNKLTWTWDYSGYHPSRNFVRSKKKTVTVKDPAALRAIIAKGKLDHDRSITLPSNPHQTYTITLKVGKATVSAEGVPPSADQPKPEGWPALDELHDALSALVN
jgi:hypothetical protein